MDDISIPNIYSDVCSENPEKIKLHIETYNIKNLDIDEYICNTRQKYETDMWIIKKSSSNKMQYNTTQIQNSYVYFSIFHTYRDKFKSLLEQSDEIYENVPYIDFYNIHVRKKKYNITFNCVHMEYMTNDIYIQLFRSADFLSVFNIYVHLIDPITKKIYKFDYKKKYIKFTYQNYIFKYKIIKRNEEFVELQMSSINDIIKNKIINIDITYDDINTIYEKYENAFDKLQMIFDYDTIFYILICISELKTQIKGDYYPAYIYASKI